jgi:hypothetical protein
MPAEKASFFSIFFSAEPSIGWMGKGIVFTISPLILMSMNKGAESNSCQRNNPL